MSNASVFDPGSAQVASIAGFLAAALGLVFNTLTLFVILKSSKLRSNCIAPLVCALAVSDMTFSFELIMVALQFQWNKAFGEGTFWCDFAPILYRCSFVSSAVFLTLISVQRVVLIQSLNQTTHLFTWKKTLAYFGLLWTILVLLQLLPLFGVWGKIGHNPGLPYCTMWTEEANVFTDLNKLIHLIVYFLPLITLIICYVIIQKSMKHSGLREGEVLMTKTAIRVVGAFVFLYTPGFLVFTFNPMPGDNAVPQLHVAAYLLAWSHAFINPIIYTYYNRFFRRAACKVLKLKAEEDDKAMPKNSQRGAASSRHTNQTQIIENV